MAEMIADKVAARISGKIDATRQKARTVEERAERQLDHVARMERLADGLETLALWLRDEPGSRRPRWSREEIAAAALRVVDAEGIEHLSMRRLAAELGAGTMTLYHYVKTKDEVVALMGDAVMGEIRVPDEELEGLGWRESLQVIARSTRDALLRHPWVMDVPDGPMLSPNAIAHFDQSLGALAGLPLDLETKLDVISSVDEYVFGYCVHRRNETAATDTDTGANTGSGGRGGGCGGGQRALDVLIGYVVDLVAGGGYPNLSELVAEDDEDLGGTLYAINLAMADPARFERNLDRLLTGIASDLGL